MKGWLSCVASAGLAGFLLVMSEFSPGWAGCAIYVTPEQGTGVNTTSPDIFVAVVGGNGVVQYSFFDSNSSTSSTPFDTNGDTTDGDGSAHSTTLPFASTASELSSNTDLSVTNGNNWPGIAGSGSTTFQPVPGSPVFASGADITCIRVADSSDREIMMIGRNGLGGVSRCVYDLDGDQDFIEKGFESANNVGDLDDDGWAGLTSQSPCRDVEQ